MTYISCENTDCVHNDEKVFCCNLKLIRIGEVYERGCMNYTPYSEEPDYQEPYYICVRTKSGKLAKAQKRGKKFVYGGYTFFTSERVTEYEDCYLTEKRTGLNCGTLKEIKDKERKRIEEIDRISKDFPNIETLPDAQWIPTGELFGDYEIMENAEDDNETN